jgi:hypothetical protein
MTRTIRIVLACSLVALGSMASVRAHHSFAAAFDMTKPITVQGTIVQVRLENPHSWFFLDVKDQNGQVQRWAFEAGTPSGMIRNGFKPGIIKAGVPVTIKGFHARVAAHTVGMRRAHRRPDGPTTGLSGPHPAPAAQ